MAGDGDVTPIDPLMWLGAEHGADDPFPFALNETASAPPAGLAPAERTPSYVVGLPSPPGAGLFFEPPPLPAAAKRAAANRPAAPHPAPGPAAAPVPASPEVAPAAGAPRSLSAALHTAILAGGAQGPAVVQPKKGKSPKAPPGSGAAKRAGKRKHPAGTGRTGMKYDQARGVWIPDDSECGRRAAPGEAED